MNKILYIILFLLFSSLAGCGKDDAPYSSNYFYPQVVELFNEINYEITYGISNDFVTTLQIELVKKDNTLEEINTLRERLEANGWKYDWNIKELYWLYCKPETNEAFRILYPTDEQLIGKNGEYFITDFDQSKVFIWITYHKDNSTYTDITDCSK